MGEDELDVWELYDLPAEPFTDEVVWKGAKQMMDIFPGEAEQAASDRADKALEQGDLSNFALWNHIAKALAELVRQSHDPSAIN